ncbi:hypothetical protein DOR48_19125 [Salmonella enterica subsp. houtenae]|nr:hypothetical protein [Salmonella enterica subsp. houtenae]EAC0081049.1 hypothetical protein [Salmonella enterica subsp. enterica serovar Minnesota]EBV4730103.1 hypothetical protein [Salmonella enterica subsp. enterica serovar Tennessee]EBW3221288.1 hypothetical protein [Salmonella enterica subsp. enterica serovar Ago]EBY0815223.1 hypothetical protein [Salmonella enterica subsp. enterica serovar Lattenkamp]
MIEMIMPVMFAIAILILCGITARRTVGKDVEETFKIIKIFFLPCFIIIIGLLIFLGYYFD